MHVVISMRRLLVSQDDGLDFENDPDWLRIRRERSTPQVPAAAAAAAAADPATAATAADPSPPLARFHSSSTQLTFWLWTYWKAIGVVPRDLLKRRSSYQDVRN